MTAEERRKIENEWIAWERRMNKDLKGTSYRVVYLPDEDLMPYEHIGITTAISDKVIKLDDEYEFEEREAGEPAELQLDNEEQVNVLNMALSVYKAALMATHGERVREELRKAMKEREEARRSGNENE